MESYVKQVDLKQTKLLADIELKKTELLAELELKKLVVHKIKEVLKVH